MNWQFRAKLVAAVSIGLMLVPHTFAAKSEGQAPKKEDVTQHCAGVRYRVYETTNLLTRLQLDTQTGQLWQLHMASGNKSEMVRLSMVRESLLPIGAAASNDRFALYPTGNMYSFILLDQEDGRTWQVQWSFDAEKRGIIDSQPALSLDED